LECLVHVCGGCLCFFWFFFFSSRRRHTRFSRDWSSDVCSPILVDLCVRLKLNVLMLYVEHTFRSRRHPAIGADADGLAAETLRRSEERRVGKECRSRWSAYH